MKPYYLCHSADIIECMANSDNVIRAGLTPKLRDIPNLLAGLTYTSGLPSQHVVQPVPFRPPTIHHAPAEPQFTPVVVRTLLYDPPAPEFSVLYAVVPPGSTETHRALGGPSVAIALAGCGIVRWAEAGTLNVSVGHVIFLGQGIEVRFEAEATVEDGKQDLVLCRAFVEADD